jgi:hypothetical protein
VYILAGWESSAYDARVLQNTQDAQGFKTVPGKYWLGILPLKNSLEASLLTIFR